MISNVRMIFRKEGVRPVELLCPSPALPEGGGMDAEGRKYLAASEYWIDMVKDEGGEWKIAKWAMKI